MRSWTSSRYSGGFMRTRSTAPPWNICALAARSVATSAFFWAAADFPAVASRSAVTASTLAMSTRVARPGKTISSRWLPMARTTYPRVPLGSMRALMIFMASAASGGGAAGSFDFRS